MAIKIVVKKGGSNKTQTKAEKDLDKGTTGSSDTLQSASLLIPFIDRLAVVVKPHSIKAAHLIHQAVVASWNDKSFLQGAKKSGDFKTAHRVVVPKYEHRPLLFYDYAQGEALRLRFDFNPARLGLDGMLNFHAQLSSIMDGGWAYAIAHGKISMIDITVDVPAVRMDEFLFIPRQTASKVAWWKQGYLETIVLGKPSGNQTRIYNKKKEQLGKGKPWEGKTTIRIERRLRNPSPGSLMKLPSLKNPWAGTTVAVNFPGPGKTIKANEWSMFADSVRQRGPEQALALLPKERKARYRKHLKQNSVPWWDPEAIWANWPKYLQGLPIGDKVFFASK